MKKRKNAAFCSILVVSMALCLSGSTFAQVPPPRDARNLEQRYEDLSCALVLIQSGNKLGTGFYINPDGDIVTALHVLGDRTFESQGEKQFRINLASPPIITIRNKKEEFTVPSTNLDNSNGDAWGADLTFLKTGRPAICWLRIGDDKKTKPGQHVLAMGFPALAFGSLSLYSGIVSARLKSNLIVGRTTSGQPLVPTNEFLRVQMPISTGISGAPVIDDENRVIAVVTSAGAWSEGLELLTQMANRNQLGAAVPQPNTLNLAALLGQLAGLLHDFVSPGYGDAVPLSYLTKKVPQENQPPSPPVH